MYPTIEDLQTNYLVDPLEKRPLCICEYTHAMGNSCGDVRDYWELINKEDRIIGAFVWEWCDHAVLVDGKLLYGSDFPERHNDGNFCVDGLVTPFRKFKSNTLEVQAIYGGKYQLDIPHHKCIENYKKPAKTNLKYCFNEKTGYIEEILVDGKNILKTPIKPCFHRAFIDNEMHIKWKLEKLIAAEHKLISKIEKDNNITLSYLVAGEEDYLRYELDYIFGVNEIHITLSYEVLSEIIPMRAGVYFGIDKQSEVTFRGYGPTESYIDKCVHNTYGEHIFNVDENLNDNLKPQESGSRYGVSYFKTKNIEVLSLNPFSFNVQPYSLEHLSTCKHNYELVKDDATYINLDVAMAGVGSNSCGPELAGKYNIPKKSSNTFVIKIK